MVLSRVAKAKRLTINLTLVLLLQSCALSLTNETGFTSNVVEILQPTAQLKANGGEVLSITWQTAEIEGVDSSQGLINLYFSDDDGGTWNSIVSGIKDSGSFDWTMPQLDSSQIRVAVELLNGEINRYVESDSFSVDSSAPSFSPGTFKINGGSSSTGNFNVRVEFDAQDNATNITDFCLKYTSTVQPLETDSCWVAVNAPAPGLSPALNLELENFYTTIGLIGGTYTIYAWVKDEHGKISELSSGGVGTSGQDKATINFSPSTPPVVVDVIATGRDDPSDPPTVLDKTITSTSDVFIKWNVTDAEGLSSAPISIEYSTDDLNWTTAVTGLLNSQNGGCTIDHAGTSADDTATGCYLWSSGSPTSGYYKVRVVALDDSSIKSAASSTAINASKVNVLAGNVDHGLGFSASSAKLFSNDASATYGNKHSFVITTTGLTIIKDRDRGILYVDPADGLLKTLIAYNSSNASNFGDGGPVSGATIKYAVAINLDFNDRLLIWDNERIRRVTLNYANLSASTIETIIGGGGSSADTLASALDMQIVVPGLAESQFVVFEPLPNGKIYFNSRSYQNNNATYRLRVYDSAAANQITSIIPGGTGAESEPTLDLSLCRIINLGFGFNTVSSAIENAVMDVQFDLGTGCLANGASKYVELNPLTFQSTGAAGAHPTAMWNYEAVLSFHKNGRNGKLYTVGKNYGKIWRYNSVSKDFEVIIGGVGVGECTDGTPALSCAINPTDVWVTAAGRVYFMDREQIRFIDDSGNIQTIMGQGWAFGDGGSALFARFKEIADFDIRNSGDIILLDADARRFREFTSGGTIATIAGNGEDAVPDLVNLAINEPLNLEQAGTVWDNFSIDPTNGDVFFPRNGTYLGRLNRATGIWEDVITGGGTHYSSADGLTGTNISLGSYPARPLGFNGTDLLLMLRNYLLPNSIDSMLKLYDASASFLQRHLAGNTGVFSGNFCADGNTLATCNVGEPRDNISGQWDAANSRWLILHERNRTKVRTLPEGGNIGTLDTLSNQALSFAYYDDTVNEHVFYCNESTGIIHDKIVGGADTALAWPISSMSCKGNKMIYDSGADKIVFIFEQNGMQGIAEYLNP